MASVNISRQQEQNLLICEICDKEFKSNNGLKYHFNTFHKLMKEHQCNICQQKFKLQSQLTSHVKITHENQKKEHECEICEKIFITKQKLKIHYQNVHAICGEKYNCNICNKLSYNLIQKQFMEDKKTTNVNLVVNHFALQEI